jgi:hypothetical protein
MVGRELSCKRVGSWISIWPTSLPLTLAPPPPFLPLGLQPPPFPSPLPWTPPPPISFLLKPLQPPPHKTLAPPPPLQGAALPLGSPSCGCELSVGVWREEEGRRKGRTQGEFVIIFCCLCSAIKLIMCLSMRIGSVAVQKNRFSGGRTAVVLAVFWEFFVGN